ncbi:hypothetical protein BJX99DRAFT_226458 [Aspergillus californicus]
MAGRTGQRPLSEVSPTAQRRNSPVWNQGSKTMKNPDSSPYESPSSTRLFWQGRDSGSSFRKNSENHAPYDPETAFSPSKRPSIENLKRASRVKNNSMFRDYNQEYDPANVYVPQRPIAFGQDYSQRQSQGASTPRSQSPDKTQIGPRPPSPSKEQVSPAKSSLSRGSRFGTKDMGFDPESDIYTDIDGTHFATKSVTFDAGPPMTHEYENETPAPSSIESDSRDGSYDSQEDERDASFERDSSIDRDDSFDASLEDLEKTPVVMPEDWSFMSPETANDDLVKEDEDSFVSDISQSPEPRASSRQDAQAKHSRVESLDSNGERRPLPPLPAIQGLSFTSRTPSPDKLSAAFELGCSSQRVLPAPPAPASYSKSDISELGHSSMSLEDRLRLMMIQRQERESKSEGGDPEESAETTDKDQCREHNEAKVEVQEHPPAGDAPDVFSAPRISRDSILRDLRSGDEDYMDDDSYETLSQGSSSPRHYSHYDPDVPIPSLESDHDNNYEDDEDDDDDSSSVVIKQEGHDDDHDNLYDLPEYYGTIPSKDSSFKDLKDQHHEDDESHYSSHSMEDIFSKSNGSQTSEETPVPADRTEEFANEHTIAAEKPKEDGASSPKMSDISESLRRPVTPDNLDEISAPSTPDSVIRHPVDEDISDLEDSADESIPDPIATVKSPGGALKIRPSLTRADVEAMAATRRKISGQIVPPELQAPEHPKVDETDPASSEEAEPSLPPPPSQPSQPSQLSNETPRKPSFMKLDIPFSIQEDEGLGFGLDKEFDRVMESQKRGYLMRHNTKVIVADSRPEEEPTPTTSTGEPPAAARGGRAPGSPQRKASQQTWTTVPWNSGARRASIRTPSGAIRKKPVAGPAPPLPGQPSIAQEPPAPVEEVDPALDTAFEDGEERGRVFVKVVGLKYLDLSLPRGERSHFSLTLDNGLHCVTTAWLELGKTAPIGQEFELIVQNDLEFQLTLQMKLDEEKFKTQEPVPSSSPLRQKQSTFSKMFASPRKRKELDMKQQLASQQQKKQDPNAPVWERLKTLVAQDGSFARAYVSLAEHEQNAYGRPYTVDVPCYNEWAVDEQPSSVKSKKSTLSTMSQRRPPYKIGKLELQLLFVPKPKGAKDDDMPKSMSACIREMRDAENASTRTFEGFLSQQGGDCPYWRRRFFRLEGAKLTAYHETNRQPRANINLAKAAKLIDDRSTLTQRETTARGGKRRKSAFAEEEEGYMFVEEGFRIRFGNGEVIDFYADSPSAKEGWMKVLADTVGKGPSSTSQVKPWTELVLKRERSVKAPRRQTADRFSQFGVAPPPPVKKDINMAPPPTAPAPASHTAPRPRHKHTQSQPDVRSAESRRQKARSLIF